MLNKARHMVQVQVSAEPIQKWELIRCQDENEHLHSPRRLCCGVLRGKRGKRRKDNWGLLEPLLHFH